MPLLLTTRSLWLPESSLFECLYWRVVCLNTYIRWCRHTAQYTTLAVMPAASSLVFATALAGSVYDRHATPPADGGDGPALWCVTILAVQLADRGNIDQLPHCDQF